MLTFWSCKQCFYSGGSRIFLSVLSLLIRGPPDVIFFMYDLLGRLSVPNMYTDFFQSSYSSIFVSIILTSFYKG